MKTVITVAMLTLLALNSIAQLQYKFSTAYQLGYENNIFLSPDSYEKSGDVLVKDELIKKGFFHDVNFGFGLVLKKKKHRLKWKNNADGRLFPKVVAGNVLSVCTQLDYQYKFHKKWTFLSNGQFKRNYRGGLGQEENDGILYVPFAYKEYKTENGIQYKATKNITSAFKFAQKKKIFDMKAGKELAYKERKYSFKVAKKFEIISGLQHKITLELNRRERFYTSSRISKKDGLPIINKRHWRYSTAKITYKMPLNKHLSIMPSLQYEKREDLSSFKYDYQQISPGFGLEYKYKSNVITSFQAKYHTRRHPNLVFINLDDIETDLQYKSWDITADIQYKIAKHVYLIASAKYTQRASNKDFANSKFNRSYNNFSFQVGIKMAL